MLGSTEYAKTPQLNTELPVRTRACRDSRTVFSWLETVILATLGPQPGLFQAVYNPVMVGWRSLVVQWAAIFPH
jgi:hypothetical protein